MTGCEPIQTKKPSPGCFQPVFPIGGNRSGGGLGSFRFTRIKSLRCLLLCLAMLLVVAHVRAADTKVPLLSREFFPDQVWRDNHGVPINAHGGGVIFFGGCYYWFGEHKMAGRSKAEKKKDVFECYTSTNLYQWKDEGAALALDRSNEQGDLAAGCILERPKVIYNESNRKFVMFFKLYPAGTGYQICYVGVATADQPAGPYVYRHKFLGGDSTNGSGDFALARDRTGAVYHLTVRKSDRVFCAARLRNDDLYPEGDYHPVAGIEKNTEAPAIVPVAGGYYLLGSGSSGWRPNAARAYFSTNLSGPYQALGNPVTGVNPHNGLGPDKTFGGQISFVIPVVGRSGAYIAMFDVWQPGQQIKSRYIWLPLQFNNGRPLIEWHTEWNLSLFENK